MNISIRKPFDGTHGISQMFGENPKMYAIWGYAGHFGVDFLTPWGTPVLACADGTVKRAGFTAGNGNFCEIDHGWGLSLYLHLNKLPIPKIGEKILKGGLIGHSGNTGAVSPRPTPQKPKNGSHLHFSVKIKGMKNPAYQDFIDPMPLFC